MRNLFVCALYLGFAALDLRLCLPLLGLQLAQLRVLARRECLVHRREELVDALVERLSELRSLCFDVEYDLVQLVEGFLHKCAGIFNFV